MGSLLMPFSGTSNLLEEPSETREASSNLCEINLSSADLRLLQSEAARIPGPLDLPPFLPQEHIHNHWTFCRIFSQEITNVLEKHLKSFNSDYLSTLLLGEIVYERVTPEDDGQDFDSSVFFQAVRVVKCKKLFSYGQGKKRLQLECREVDTSSNVDVPRSEMRREVIAINLLAELMAACVKTGDFLVIYGDISLTKSKVIVLNSRLQHHVVVAHYRHDGFTGPVSLESDHLRDVVSKCRDPRFRHVLHENGKHEATLHITPNIQFTR